MPYLPLAQTSSFFDFGASGPASAITFKNACAGLLLSAALGAAVAGFYLFSTRTRPRTPGLAGTLVLLSMLITLVTLAIGDNAAKAFTLVGTLAIVRFRTAVHDIRDTAFVIFAVAVGISIGAFNPVAAATGTLLVGAASALLSRRAAPTTDDAALLLSGGRLTLRFDKPGRHQPEVEPIIASHTRIHQLLAARDGRDGGLRLVYAVDIDRAEAAALVHALHDVEGVKRVALTFGEIDDDD